MDLCHELLCTGGYRSRHSRLGLEQLTAASREDRSTCLTCQALASIVPGDGVDLFVMASQAACRCHSFIATACAELLTVLQVTRLPRWCAPETLDLVNFLSGAMTCASALRTGSRTTW